MSYCEDPANCPHCQKMLEDIKGDMVKVFPDENEKQKMEDAVDQAMIPPFPDIHSQQGQKEFEALTERVAEKTKAAAGMLPDPPKPKPPPQPERSRVKFYRPSRETKDGDRMYDVHNFHTTGKLECTFPPCKNTFKAEGIYRKYCSKKCRKKDGPFRKKREEFERAQPNQ